MMIKAPSKKAKKDLIQSNAKVDAYCSSVINIHTHLEKRKNYAQIKLEETSSFLKNQISFLDQIQESIDIIENMSVQLLTIEELIRNLRNKNRVEYYHWLQKYLVNSNLGDYSKLKSIKTQFIAELIDTFYSDLIDE